MRNFVRWNGNGIRIAAAALALVAAGCGPLESAREEDHPLMRRALALDRAGNTKEAIDAYQRALEVRPQFARAHLNLAALYNRPPAEDFLRAVYHFDRYLELRPDAQNAENIRELSRRARINFAATLPTAGANESIQLVADLRREISMLRSRIAELESTPATLAPAPSPSPARASPVAARPGPARGSATAAPESRPATTPAAPTPTLARPAPAPAPGPRTHVVKAGETLSSIANKAYNDSSAWRKIFEANQDQLTSPSAIREGQTLVIP
ncbi:MAG: LysM peptidoglycan-binding domain-containing protein [Kiritimatiellae bacterium]|nr:LysM peptidoglycan-binding domain-containing protein [Kiritimatiellia bacterium]